MPRRWSAKQLAKVAPGLARDLHDPNEVDIIRDVCDIATGGVLSCSHLDLLVTLVRRQILLNRIEPDRQEARD